MKFYTRTFYDRRASRAARSADALVPIVAGLMPVRSVVDVGCGDGTWLRAFAEHGAAEIQGIDGPWVPEASLRIPPGQFRRFDLGTAPLPYRDALPQDRRYDLAISFELLEHLEEDRADALVELLCSLSDTLLVSAAAPHQGGTRHVNEQWPDYWADRFARRGYKPFDFLRYAVWDDERIAPWYRQNIIGYFKGDIPPSVRAFGERGIADLLERPRAVCHPGVFSYKLGKLRGWIKRPVASAWRELRKI